ncbi:hypothetical protein A2635_00760 [Candidatus Peribacteria bacterium RIFCSPHIGHO2_01_FULL_51_9]|nr:MAG: hypothetical protein A2635_00760 [Candidatus Peribacteria bacterium RIFCSPHIGHO2_01_FULL_51_9]
MPVVPTFLQSTVDPILKRLQRTFLYYRRYRNSLNIRVNERYLKYARDCAATYRVQHGAQNFPPSPLWTVGAQRLKEVMPQEKATMYSSKITQLIGSNDKNIVHPEKYRDLQVRILKPFTTLGADLLDIFRSPNLHNALLAYFKGNYRIEWASAFRSLAAKERLVDSWLWHIDSFPPYVCKIFFHLTPATVDTGVTDFMDHADTLAYHRAGYHGQYGSERKADLEEFAREHGLPYRPFHLDVEAGDATLFDVNCFHRGVAPRRAFRDVVQFLMVPNPIPWDEELKHDSFDRMDFDYGHDTFPKNPRRRGF